MAAGQALALAEPLAGLTPRAVDEVRARSHHVLGVAHSIRGLPDLAVEHWQRTMEAARRAGLRQVENRCPMNIGMVLYQYHDDLAGALRCFNQAPVQLALGQVDEARARLVRVMQETEHIGDQRVRSILVDTLAVASMVAGDNAAALAALQREAANPGLRDDVKMRNELDSHLALSRLASGDLAGARAVGRSASGSRRAGVPVRARVDCGLSGPGRGRSGCRAIGGRVRGRARGRHWLQTQ